MLVAAAEGYPFAAAATVLLVFALIGLGLAVLIPHRPAAAVAATVDGAAAE